MFSPYLTYFTSTIPKQRNHLTCLFSDGRFYGDCSKDLCFTGWHIWEDVRSWKRNKKSTKPDSVVDRFFPAIKIVHCLRKAGKPLFHRIWLSWSVVKLNSLHIRVFKDVYMSRWKDKADRAKLVCYQKRTYMYGFYARPLVLDVFRYRNKFFHIEF